MVQKPRPQDPALPGLTAAVLLITACAGSAGTQLHAAKECTPESPEFHLQRGATVEKAYAAGQDAVASITPFPAQGVREACARVDEIVRPICFEGAATGYGARISEGHLGPEGERAAIADFEQQMRLADDRSTRFHCRGLGDGIVSDDQVDHMLPLLSKRCRNHVLEGHSDLKAWGAVPDGISCGDSTADCDPRALAFFSRFDVDHLCARYSGGDVEWCAYGTGRMLGNFFSGRFERATEVCRGRGRGPCLSGIGFVSVYLYPDRIDRALGVAAQLPTRDQPAYFEGVANGLRWRQETDPARIGGWLDRLSPSARALANDVLAAATRCGLVDFHDGVNCRWPTVQPGCGI